ncbi:MAG: hypothetical protein ACM3OO_09265 [Planctomycetaceae bacterium]
MRASAILALSAILLTASVASASPAGIHGRGPQAAAAMQAAELGHGKAIQVLTRMCTDPGSRSGCMPIPANLRRAISRLADRDLLWVARAHGHRGRIYTLAPVKMGSVRAKAAHAWRELRPHGCVGGGGTTYRFAAGTWSPRLGFAYEGCPAR